MTDERPDSLAAQAASWVPPWERPQPPLDRDYQAAAGEPDESGLVEDLAGPVAVAAPDDDEDRSGAGLSDDDDDFDDAFEGANPPSYNEVPPELAPLPGESQGPATVDAPTEVPGENELEPTDVGTGPEVPVPASIESATTEAAEDEQLGVSVDAPVPLDGDDAGDVFDAAADDDVSDDDEIDLPVTEVVPDAGSDDDEVAAPAADESEVTNNVAAVVPAQGRGGAGAGAAVSDADARTKEDVEFAGEPAAMDETELRAALEAILLVVDEPVAEMQLAQIMEQPTERVASLLEDISARYTAAGHGFDLRRAAGGWRLYTRPEYAPYVERFVLDGQSVRLTQAALETLSVVAYKQPVTRSRISAIRGVNCDGVMRTLVTRGLIEECGIESETGAFLYRTTVLFLEKLGLNSVDQLPPLAPFLPDDVEEVLDASG
jgi:segregation and condensation protein B